MITVVSTSIEIKGKLRFENEVNFFSMSLKLRNVKSLYITLIERWNLPKPLLKVSAEILCNVMQSV